MEEDRSRIAVLLCTTPPGSAPDLARRLVNSRLAACVNIVDKVSSVYRWEGELCQEEESLLVIKTAAEVVPELMRQLVDWHPYSVPEVISLPVVAGSEPYLRWVLEETAPNQKDG